MHSLLKPWSLLVLLACVAGQAAPSVAQPPREKTRGWLERLGRLRAPGPNERNHQTIREAFRDVIEPVRPSVVQIISAGSQVAYGAIVDESGLVLTKYSELKGELVCQLHDGHRVAAEQLAADGDADLALLQLEVDRPLTPVVWREDPIEVGSWIASIGMGDLPVASGVVSNLPRRIPRRMAYLGVMLSPDAPPRVEEVREGSAAERAGLRVGDIVLQADAEPVKDRDSLVGAIRKHRPGDPLLLKVRRLAATESPPASPPAQDDSPAAGDQPPQPAAGNATAPSTLQPEPPSEIELRAYLGDMDELNPQANLGGPLSGRRGGFPQALQHDGILTPVQCGGPIVDLDGKVVGVNIARAGRVETYALPAEYVRTVLSQLRAQAANAAPAASNNAQ